MSTQREIDVERLQDIQATMLSMVEEIQDIMRANGGFRMAESYMIPSLIMALTDDHGYMGHEYSLTDLIESIAHMDDAE
jgi:hypothetical protein